MKITWLQVLIVIVFVVVVYMILTRIFGHSATDLAIMVGLFVFSFMNQYGLNRELGEQRMMVKSSFERMRDDIQEIKVDVRGIKGRLDALERRARR